MLVSTEQEREEKRRAGTPPIMEVSEGEWESMPSASSADAKWDHQVHKGEPSSRTVSPSLPISSTSRSTGQTSLPILHEGMSPVSVGVDIYPSGPVRTTSSDDQFEVVKSPVGSQRGFGNQPPAHVLKVIILGDASVGKTAIIQRFVNGIYQALPYKPTVGADFYSQKMEVVDKKNNNARSIVTLQIWDTAGQERYRSLASSFYRGADVCLLVFDGSRVASLDSLVTWKSDFVRHASPADGENFPFIVLCNKVDLIEGRDKVNVGAVAERLEVDTKRVILASAKTGEGVERAFHMAAKTGLERAILAAQKTTKTTTQRNVQFTLPARTDPFQGAGGSSCSQC